MPDQEDEDVKRRIEDSGREAEKVMQSKMDRVLNGDVEEPVIADPSPPSQPQKSPEAPEGDKVAGGEEKAEIQEPVTKEEEEKPETEEKPVETPAETSDDVEKEIDATNLRPDAHPKTKKALDKVKQIAKREYRARKEAEKRAKEIEDEKASLKILDEPTEKELEDLRNYRKMRDIEQDPEFVDKYVKRVENLNTQSQAVVVSNPEIPKGTADFIQANGGPLTFRMSQKYMPQGLKDAQGNLVGKEDGTPYTHREFWEKIITPALTPDQRDKISFYATESLRLDMAKEEEINNAKADLGKYEEGRQKQSQTQREEFLNRVKTRAETYIKTLGDVAVKKEYPPNATKDQIAEVDKHNQRRDKAEKQFQANMANLTPENLTDAFLDHAHVDILKEDLKTTKDELEKEKTARAELQKKWDGVKSAGQTNRLQSAPSTKQEKPKSAYGQDTETLMAERMRQAGIA